MTKLYLIGSLRNEAIPPLGNALRSLGFEVFDDWFAPGPEADDFWQKYEKGRGRSYGDALQGHAGKHVFEFDKGHIESSDLCVLALPAGKSGHLELGYFLGKGKPGYILFPEEPERWDVMYQFATGVFFDLGSLTDRLLKDYENAYTVF